MRRGVRVAVTVVLIILADWLLFGLVLPTLLAGVDDDWARVFLVIAVAALAACAVPAAWRLTGPPVNDDRRVQ